MAGSARSNLSTNFTYMHDKEYSIQLIRWFLKPISAWPLTPDASLWERIVAELLLIFYFVLIFITLIPCAMGIFLDEDKDLDTKLKEMGPFSCWILTSLKYFSLLMHGNDIRRCIDHVETDWKMSRIEFRDLMLKSAKYGRYIATLCAVFNHTGLISLGIARTMMTDLYVGSDNISSRPLPYAFYNKIWDTRFSPAYEVVLTMQCFATFLSNSVTISACSLAAIFVMHARGQLQILINWLDNLVDGEEKVRDTPQERLAVIVEHHLRVLSFVSNIEKTIHVICLIELVGCTMHICLSGYYVITDWDRTGKQNLVPDIIIMIAVTFNMFIFCYIGEILSEQCGQVGEVAYMTEWYRLPKKTALGLILIILRSSSLVKITAGKMVELSFSTFGDVIKSSIAYFNILCTLTT